MSFGSGSDSFQMKKFETEDEVEEKKRRRQEQWEKVRKPDDPEGKLAADGKNRTTSTVDSECLIYMMQMGLKDTGRLKQKPLLALMITKNKGLCSCNYCMSHQLDQA